ncbi:hypothetical protein GCM10027422_46680 [Hymenobacter arcticus]
MVAARASWPPGAAVVVVHHARAKREGAEQNKRQDALKQYLNHNSNWEGERRETVLVWFLNVVATGIVSQLVEVLPFSIVVLRRIFAWQ